MGGSDKKSPAALGFLSVLDHEPLGLVGGYLILNSVGRPLEFHCTAPIKPSRAQQILYGPTLGPYLYGEQIGQTLLAKGTARPLVVCVDTALTLEVRPFASVPVALVLARVSSVEATSITAERQANCAPPALAGSVWRCDAPHALGENLNTFHLGRNHLAVSAEAPDDRAAIEDRLAKFADFDLGEPFERIREAVLEAHRVSRT